MNFKRAIITTSHTHTEFKYRNVEKAGENI